MKNLLVILAMLVAMNANAQWASYTLPYEGIPYTLGFYNLNNGVSLGHSLSPANEYIYFTTNSGANWIQANYPLELRVIIDVQYINANIIYACGAENVTFRGNYNPDKDFLTFPKHIRDRYLRSGRTEFYSEYKAAFIKSTNGGLNWQRASQFDTSKGYIMDIHFFDASTGYALIDSNSYGNTKFFKTTDSGANWQFVHRIDNASVFGMHFFDMNTGFAYGFKNGGRIYRTTDAGVNWIVTNMASQIDGITFLNSTTGIAIGVGDNLSLTYIYKTTNAGLNWNVINTINGSKLFNNLKSLQNTGTAFAIGNNIDTGIQLIDKITTLKTTNYGLNWVSKEFNPKLLAYGLALVDANNFFIGAGESIIAAQILKSTNGGNVFVNQIGTVIPSAYSLSQNYPNPFNPVTIIRFSIPAVDSHLRGNDRVLLKVYDILGKEVQTLVNESLQPGTYETSFDGSSLTSGVYFYRLITNEFSETKKMLLIK